MKEFRDEISLHDWQSQEEPTLLTNKLNRNLAILKRELRQQRTRRDRIQFLRRLVLSDIPIVDESHGETVDVPRTFRMVHRRAPSSGANMFDVLEEEEFHPTPISAEVIGAQAEVLGLAPGINTRAMALRIKDAEDSKEDGGGGFLSGLMKTFRWPSFRPGKVSPLPQPDPQSGISAHLTIPELNEDEDDDHLPVVPMGSLNVESGISQTVPKSGVMSLIPAFTLRLPFYPARQQPASPASDFHGSIARRPKRATVDYSPRRQSVAGRSGGGRRGATVENLVTKLQATIVGEKEVVPGPRIMLQLASPEPSSAESESEEETVAPKKVAPKFAFHVSDWILRYTYYMWMLRDNIEIPVSISSNRIYIYICIVRGGFNI